MVDPEAALDEVCYPPCLGRHGTPLDHLVIFALQFQQLYSVLCRGTQSHEWNCIMKGHCADAPSLHSSTWSLYCSRSDSASRATEMEPSCPGSNSQ
ncbi:hypothetical protein E2C01_012708 [Portunus trituberculatus]|uniref:Uncharacterized protein n=1 Tax=Portunus trituberculatus TaxID=210409 RepID=A0A5B7DEU2_PORTR|nr:hypothetical protein [Portunus trituberculatus]